MKKTFRMKTVLIVLSVLLAVLIVSCSSKEKAQSVNQNISTGKASDNKSKEDITKNEKSESKDEGRVSEDSSNKKEDSEKKTEAAESEATNSEKKTIVIDPGHGKGGNRGMEKQSPDSDIMKIKDPGGAEGVVTKVPEYEVTFKVAVKLKDMLTKEGYNVIMTRTSNDYSPGNIERAEIGNENNAALTIRLHCDSADTPSAKGASMLVPANVGYAKSIKDISREYGETILSNLVSEAQMYNRGVIERSDLTGFNWSKVPVVLVEMGFMSNSREDRLLNSDDYQNKLAEGLCKGIVKAVK